MILWWRKRRGGDEPHSMSARFVTPSRRLLYGLATAEASGHSRERMPQPRVASDQALSDAKLRIHILTAKPNKCNLKSVILCPHPP